MHKGTYRRICTGTYHLLCQPIIMPSNWSRSSSLIAMYEYIANRELHPSVYCRDGACFAALINTHSTSF